MTDLSRSVRRCLNVAAVLSTASFASGPALAATSELEEVVVTAQKQEQKLSETPMSVTALTPDNLEALAATKFVDYANTVPGLQFTTDGVGATQVNLRGITSGTNVSPTVGIYVDEVPYGSSTAYGAGAQLALDAGLFDLSRIEILRGPQGTLYGASTMGGLLKYVTVAPNLHEVEGSLRAGLATTEEGGTSYDVAGVLNTPLGSDKAAGRLSGYYTHDGGYIDDIGRNKDDVNRSDVYGGRADFLLQPTEQLSIRLTAFLQEISRDGSNSADYYISNSKPVNGSLDQTNVLPEPFDQSFQLYSGTLQYDFGQVALTSVTSYQTVSSDSKFDISDLYVPLLNFVFGLADDPPGTFPFRVSATGLTKDISTNKFTEEVRLASSGPTIDWLLGGFYTHENSGQFQELPAWDLDGQPFPLNLYTVKLPSYYDETAGFGTVTWHVNEKLDLAGGLRYAHNSQGSQQIGSSDIGLIGSVPELKSSDDVMTYLADLRYRANENLMTYLRYATGYRPGGPNLTAYDIGSGQLLAPPTYKPDKLQSYEGGIKASTADRRYSADLAVYLINWDDMQVPVTKNGFTVIGNAGTARSTGTELTLTAIPVERLTLVGAFSYIDAKLTSDAPGLGGADGDRLPDTPDFTATVSADYAFDVAGHSSGAGVVFRYVDDRVSGFDQSPGAPNYQLPSYTSVDLRGSMAFGPAQLRLYVRNLFDERGQLSAGTTSNFLVTPPALVSIMQPRTIGMSVDYDF